MDQGLKVQGIVNVAGKLIIVGAMEGTLVGNTVVAAAGSHVVAEARVREMVIAGNFEGNVTAYESLKILQTGNFRGNIVCKNLDVEPGGQLNGSVKILEADAEGFVADTEDSGAGAR